ncbi:MAG: tRNA lysidine(34) synthetase TilS [Cypionkella sp.]
MSGGPDSLALLLLAHAARPEALEAATVDHGLRPDSAAEARHVAAVCAALSIRHEVLRVEVVAGNLQANARTARYGALDDWAASRGIERLATAHHADDQAETVLMRLNRGSGVAGLAGIRERLACAGRNATIVRPLLRWRRVELARIVENSPFTAVADPSNHDPAFDRVRMRQALAAMDWLDPAAIARSAALLAEAGEALEWLALEEREAQVERTEQGYRYRSQSRSRLQVIYVLRSLMGRLDRSASLSALARVVDEAKPGRPRNLGGVLFTLESEGVWRLELEPPRRTG